MATTVQLDVTPTALLEAMRRMDDATFDNFYRQVITIRADRIAPTLSQVESKLLQKIARAHLPANDHSRLIELGSKLEDETISHDELEAFGLLTDRAELLNVDRLAAVHELATLRRQPFHDLMLELGLLNQYA